MVSHPVDRVFFDSKECHPALLALNRAPMDTMVDLATSTIGPAAAKSRCQCHSPPAKCKTHGLAPIAGRLD